jgi:predicted dienelactone hydrolase
MDRFAFLLLCLGVPSLGAHISIAGKDVALWKPGGAPPAQGYPVVLFSHGFGGCNTQSTFLMDALAEAGYFVLAPNHPDARCGSARNGGAGWRPEEPFRKEAEWSDATYHGRATDLQSVLDAVLREKTFQGVPVDSSRVGLAGHSLGGYTVLGLAGAWPSWKDSRVKAVLALSPYCSPYVLKGDLRHLNVPVMYQGGTLDLGVTPTVQRLNGAYDVSAGPKFYVEFEDAGHLAWTNLNKRFQELIDRYSVAFFDRYLKGNSAPDPLQPLTQKPFPRGVSYLRAAN